MATAALIHIDGADDADLAETFGPQWQAVVSLVRRAARLTTDEAHRLDAAWDAAALVDARAAAWDAAFHAARDAAYDAARTAAHIAAWDAASTTWGASDA